MAMCSCAQCVVVVHTIPMGHDRKIFEDEIFVGMSCWDIAHSSECKGIWSVTESAGGSSVRRDGIFDMNEVKAMSYSMKRSHQIVKDMANEYGHRERRPRRRISRDVENDQICRDCEIE